VYDFLWSQDGSCLYYFEDKLGGMGETVLEGETADPAPQQPADPYPYTLWAYELDSGENYAVCDLPGTGIYASPDANELYFAYYDEETMGENIRATYRIRIEKNLDAE